MTEDNVTDEFKQLLQDPIVDEHISKITELQSLLESEESALLGHLHKNNHEIHNPKS